MSHKLQIVLPDPVALRLRELAAGADTPPSTLAARLVAVGVALVAGDAGVAPPKPAPVLPAHRGGERAPWLEPCGGDPAWRREMWGRIVALHGRYPRALGTLKEGWWTDETHTETLCALALWRAEIDDTGVDPREEIAFHDRLAAYADTLRREGGGVTKAWRPGAPPAEWAAG